MQNTNTKLEELAKTQANSLLGNIIAEMEASDHYTADIDILNKVFSDEKVRREFDQIKGYLTYYNGDSLANLHEFTMIFRLGIRIGAYYEIEDHKKNNYGYFIV